MREKLQNAGSFHCESILAGFFPLVNIRTGKEILTDQNPHSNRQIWAFKIINLTNC